MIGRQGIEKTYEKLLRGKKGKELFQKDRFNRIIGAYEGGVFDQKPEAAENLVLTIDANLQAFGEALMINKRGGIVAIEPQTGEILSLVSAPNFNPNLLTGRDRSEYFRKLLNDMKVEEAMQFIQERMMRTKTNAEFLDTMSQ